MGCDLLNSGATKMECNKLLCHCLLVCVCGKLCNCIYTHTIHPPLPSPPSLLPLSFLSPSSLSPSLLPLSLPLSFLSLSLSPSSLSPSKLHALLHIVPLHMTCGYSCNMLILIAWLRSGPFDLRAI